jgi:hypothetical protein
MNAIDDGPPGREGFAAEETGNVGPEGTFQAGGLRPL